MKCAVHPEVEAVGFCRNCGKAMCAGCVRPVRDMLYCEDCLAGLMGIAAPPRADAYGALPGSAAALAPVGTPIGTPVAARGNGNAAAAFLLGLVPGLGAIYNGEYNKAMVHILIFGGIIIGLTGVLGDSLTGFWVLALVGFVFYMAIDALRTVKARETGEVIADPFENITKNKSLGPFLLIGIGAIFLLHNFGFFEAFRVREIFWPVVLIGIGVLMLRNKVRGND